jgi:hypothetical protein
MRIWYLHVLLTVFSLLAHCCGAQESRNSQGGIYVPAEYSISECLTNCSMQSEVIFSQLNGSFLNIKVGVNLNCSVNDKSNITYTFHGDTLNIIVPEVQINRDTIITKTDSTETIVISESRSTASCNCFFHVELTILDCSKVPTTVLINNNTLAENFRSRVRIVKED